MGKKKREHPKEKFKLHIRNKHRERYDFKKLTETSPELAPFVRPNKYGDESVDFSDPQAVRILNKALLKFHYNIEFWDIPKDYLCPPIPGRADYLHYMADLLGGKNFGTIPTGSHIKCLDVGIGSSAVYPILGNASYGWSFIGSDIDKVALESAEEIISQNPQLKGQVECRLQPTPKDIFYGVLRREERIDMTVCNPPFHASQEAAEAGTLRKLSNLKKVEVKETKLNFGGKQHELWCDGGEKRFVKNMIRESKNYAASCFWFSTLISKQGNLKAVYEDLKEAKAVEVKTIPMGQGNKSSRLVAWTFFDLQQQEEWRKKIASMSS